MPVTASMRRRPLPILPSLVMAKPPMALLRARWVPPQSSLLKSPICTRRTRSPYFSPNSATAPCARGLVERHLVHRQRIVLEREARDAVLNPLPLIGGERGEVREVETQPVGLDQGAGLQRVRSEGLTQHEVQEMGGGMGAGEGLAARDINRSLHVQSDA